MKQVGINIKKLLLYCALKSHFKFLFMGLFLTQITLAEGLEVAEHQNISNDFIESLQEEVEKALSVSEIIIGIEAGRGTLAFISFLKAYGYYSKHSHLEYYEINKAATYTPPDSSNYDIYIAKLFTLPALSYLENSLFKRSMLWFLAGETLAGASFFFLSSDADASTMDDYYSSEEGFQEFQGLPIEERKDIIRIRHLFRKNLLALGDKIKEHIDWNLMSKEEQNEYIRE